MRRVARFTKPEAVTLMAKQFARFSFASAQPRGLSPQVANHGPRSSFSAESLNAAPSRSS